MNEFGIAGYLYHQPILHDKTMTMLELPAATKATGTNILELCSVFFESQDAEYLNKVRTSAEDAGVTIRSIAVDRADISVADEAERRTNIETIKQWFHVAKAIGSEAIRVNSGGSVDATEEELERIIAGYRELVIEAALNGVYLLIENHGGASYKPENVQRFIEDVDSEWFRTCPDTGNYPDGTWEEGIRAMAPYAHSVHVKVTQYSDDGWQPRTGNDGTDRTVNLKSILTTLKKHDYQGPFCIEAGVPDDETEAAREAIAYVKEVLARV